jgi:hypothetical protein
MVRWMRITEGFSGIEIVGRGDGSVCRHGCVHVSAFCIDDSIFAVPETMFLRVSYSAHTSLSSSCWPAMMDRGCICLGFWACRLEVVRDLQSHGIRGILLGEG